MNKLREYYRADRAKKQHSDNYSTTVIELYGDKKIEAFEFLSDKVVDYKNIKNKGWQHSLNYGKVGLSLNYRDFIIDRIFFNEDDNLVILGQGNRNCPNDFFSEYIFKEYGLSGYIEDSNPTFDFFITESFDKGENIKTECDNYRFPAKHSKYMNNEYATKKKTTALSAKDVVFIVGNPATGKTTLGEALIKKGYEAIKSTTNRPMRNLDEKFWYDFKTDEEIQQIANSEIIERAEYGNYTYLTTTEQLNKNSKKKLLKIIDAKGLKEILNKIEKGSLSISPCIVFMDIDNKTCYQNLLRSGYVSEHIKKRLDRESVPSDMIKLNIQPDIVVKELNEDTANNVFTEAEEVFAKNIPMVIKENIEKETRENVFLNAEEYFLQAKEALQQEENVSFPTITLSPTLAP